MAFLLIISLAVFFFFRMPHQVAERPTIPEHGFVQSLQQSSKPHAHLTAIGLECNQTPKSPTLAWEMRLGLADTHGFVYDQEKKALIVQSAGFYDVYLQITFRKPRSHHCVHNIHLNAIVYLTNDHDKPTIMTIYDSLPCKEYKSVSASGVYRLQANTELRVNVSDISLVDRCSETKTYFGAFLIE